ncbi:MAG: thiol peroxidase [Flavobacteriales bacterium]|nr:thiol peroxidase [Flavobacteriales bacterium]
MPPAIKGQLPQVGSQLPHFRLTDKDRVDMNENSFPGKRMVLNIFPSIDTSTCAASVRKFNQLASALDSTVVLCVSKDLPYAHKRFCGAEGIENVVTASQYKDDSFSKNYGVEISEGKMEGLFTRAIVVANASGKILHMQHCELNDEPDYQKVLDILLM